MRLPACNAAACFSAEAISSEKGFDSPSVAASHRDTRSHISAVETDVPPNSTSGSLMGTLWDTCRKMRSGVVVVPNTNQTLVGQLWDS